MKILSNHRGESITLTFAEEQDVANWCMNLMCAVFISDEHRTIIYELFKDKLSNGRPLAIDTYLELINIIDRDSRIDDVTLLFIDNNTDIFTEFNIYKIDKIDRVFEERRIVQLAWLDAYHNHSRIKLQCTDYEYAPIDNVSKLTSISDQVRIYDDYKQSLIDIRLELIDNELERSGCTREEAIAMLSDSISIQPENYQIYKPIGYNRGGGKFR